MRHDPTLETLSQFAAGLRQCLFGEEVKYHLVVTGKELQLEELQLDPEWLDSFKVAWYRAPDAKASSPLK